MSETAEKIMDRLTGELPPQYDVSAGTYTYDIEMAHAKEFENAYDVLGENEKQSHVSTATGTYLDGFVNDVGLVRKQATIASGYVTIRGDAGAVVSSGSKVAAGNVIFNIVDTATIGSDGTVTVSVICDAAGTQGNVKANYINYFPVTLQGCVSVFNAEPTEGGSDTETDSELRARYYEYMAHPITSGNKWQYVSWARSVAGVGDAKCIPLWNGNGTVKVIIVDADRQTASDELVTRVQTYIDEQHPIGATVTVESAAPVDINVSGKILMSADVKDAITENITEYLQTVSFNQGYVSYAKIGQIIMDTSGVIDYSNLKVNGGTENIPIADINVARLGGVAFE